MFVSQRKTWTKRVAFCLIGIIALIGVSGYFYFMKHKEPTHGVLVYGNEIQKEEVDLGYLYKPSSKNHCYQEEAYSA